VTQEENPKMLACCAAAEAVLTAITPSSTVPTKRTEFSEQKFCVTKRMAISEKIAGQLGVICWCSDKTFENPRQLKDLPSILALGAAEFAANASAALASQATRKRNERVFTGARSQQLARVELLCQTVDIFFDPGVAARR
jgi:hypothetical protein